MPRLTKSTPKYRRHQASGQAFVVLNGRYHYLGNFRSKESRTQYDQLIGQWLASGRSPVFGIDQESHQLTISRLVGLYRKHAEARYRAPPLVKPRTKPSRSESFRHDISALISAEFSLFAVKDLFLSPSTLKLPRGKVNPEIDVPQNI